jgi:hypothetical protein
MNTVTNLFSNKSDVDILRSAGYGSADFDVGVAPLHYATMSGLDIQSDKSAVYRTDSGAQLGIHSPKYKTVSYKDMIDSTRNLLERSDFDLNGINEHIRTSHNGARCFVKYDLPAMTYHTGDGDRAALSLLATTSFDGTWPFMISAAATQFACTNLQVFITGEVAVYRARHTHSLDIDKGSNIIMNSLNVFSKERDLWLQWQDTKLFDMEVFKLFVEASACTPAEKLIEEGMRSDPVTVMDHSHGLLFQRRDRNDPVTIMDNLPRRNSNLEYMWQKYTGVYRKRLGSTMWAAYNTLTDWSTHRVSGKEDKLAALQFDRHQIVRQVISDFAKAA